MDFGNIFCTTFSHGSQHHEGQKFHPVSSLSFLGIPFPTLVPDTFSVRLVGSLLNEARGHPVS